MTRKSAVLTMSNRSNTIGKEPAQLCFMHMHVYKVHMYDGKGTLVLLLQ